jgi:hypothetical protein
MPRVKIKIEREDLELVAELLSHIYFMLPEKASEDVGKSIHNFLEAAEMHPQHLLSQFFEECEENIKNVN